MPAAGDGVADETTKTQPIRGLLAQRTLITHTYSCVFELMLISDCSIAHFPGDYLLNLRYLRLISISCSLSHLVIHPLFLFRVSCVLSSFDFYSVQISRCTVSKIKRMTDNNSTCNESKGACEICVCDTLMIHMYIK